LPAPRLACWDCSPSSPSWPPGSATAPGSLAQPQPGIASRIRPSPTRLPPCARNLAWSGFFNVPQNARHAKTPTAAAGRHHTRALPGCMSGDQMAKAKLSCRPVRIPCRTDSDCSLALSAAARRASSSLIVLAHGGGIDCRRRKLGMPQPFLDKIERDATRSFL
jgi:hypothetical protein